MMYVAWDNGKWVPVDDRDVDSVERMGYEVIQVQAGTVIAPEWLDENHDPHHFITRQVALFDEQFANYCLVKGDGSNGS